MIAKKIDSQPIDIQIAWSQLQEARSRGDLKKASEILADIIETENINEIFLWGDTAVALGDLRLSAQAYKKAIYTIGNDHPVDALLGRYFYILLEIGTNPVEIEEELNKNLISYPSHSTSMKDEDRLVMLAFQMNLHFRKGKTLEALSAVQEFDDRRPVAIEFGTNFLTHVRSRIWLTMARLAEEIGDAQNAALFLSRIDDLQLIGTELESILKLYKVLLNVSLGDIGTQEIERLLHDALKPDLSAITPQIPSSIIISLQYCMDALGSDKEQISLLKKALQSRHSNLLARRLILARLEQLGNMLDPLLLADASLWLSAQSHSYSRLIRSYLEQTNRKSVDINFSFLALGGGAKVGGSSYLVDINGTHILLDIGLDMNPSPSSSYHNFKENLRSTEIIRGVADLDAVIISHAHLDHIGLLPALFIDPDLPRFRISSGTIPKFHFYGSDATKEIANIMLVDTSKQMQSKLDELPLYSVADALGATQRIQEPPDDNLDSYHDLGHVEFFDSGHILGSKMVMVEKNGFRMLYTGDFNRGQQITVAPAESLRGSCPDVLIMENTYGYPSDKWIMSREWQEEIFHYRLGKVLRRGGIVLLPAFAVGRSQEVLGLVAEHLYQHQDLSFSIFMDGLSRDITNCYDQFAQQLTERYREARKSIQHRLVMVPNNIDQDDRERFISEKVLGRPNIIIASSGMLKKGSASYQYFLKIAPDPKNAIFYTGYLPEDSDATDLLDSKSDDLPDIHCEQYHFQFSAHSHLDELIQFVIDIQPRAVILVHGDASKNTLNDGSLYSTLCQFQSDAFSVFLGKEGHRIDYRERRFFQL